MKFNLIFLLLFGLNFWIRPAQASAKAKVESIDVNYFSCQIGREDDYAGALRFVIIYDNRDNQDPRKFFVSIIDRRTKRPIETAQIEIPGPMYDDGVLDLSEYMSGGL